ncbi:hypothetical protein EDC04DRAFT_3091441, partial [Pisolithus marmoratus]
MYDYAPHEMVRNREKEQQVLEQASGWKITKNLHSRPCHRINWYWDTSDNQYLRRAYASNPSWFWKDRTIGALVVLLTYLMAKGHHLRPQMERFLPSVCPNQGCACFECDYGPLVLRTDRGQIISVRNARRTRYSISTSKMSQAISGQANNVGRVANRRPSVAVEVRTGIPTPLQLSELISLHFDVIHEISEVDTGDTVNLKVPRYNDRAATLAGLQLAAASTVKTMEVPASTSTSIPSIRVTKTSLFPRRPGNPRLVAQQISLLLPSVFISLGLYSTLAKYGRVSCRHQAFFPAPVITCLSARLETPELASGIVVKNRTSIEELTAHVTCVRHSNVAQNTIPRDGRRQIPTTLSLSAHYIWYQLAIFLQEPLLECRTQ